MRLYQIERNLINKSAGSLPFSRPKRPDRSCGGTLDPQSCAVRHPAGGAIYSLPHGLRARAERRSDDRRGFRNEFDRTPMASIIRRDDILSRSRHRTMDVGLNWLALVLAYALKEFQEHLDHLTGLRRAEEDLRLHLRVHGRIGFETLTHLGAVLEKSSKLYIDVVGLSNREAGFT